MLRLGRRGGVRGNGRGRACGDGGRPVGDEPVPPARRNHDEQGHDPQQRRRSWFYRNGGPQRRRGACSSDLADAKRVNAHRLGDVLERPLAEVDKVCIDPAAHLIVGGAGDANAPGFRNALQPRGEIDAVSENILAVDQHVAEVDADAVENAPRLGNVGVTLGHLLLNRDCALDRRDDGRKLQQQAVAHRLDEPPAESANDRPRRLAMLTHGPRRAGFVLAHEPGVAHHVGGEDRREAAGGGHCSGTPALRMPSTNLAIGPAV